PQVVAVPAGVGATDPASPLIVQASLVDVLHDAVGHQVPDRVTGPCTFTAVGRRDRQGRHLHQRDPVLGQVGHRRGVQLRAGTGDTDEVGQLEQFLHASPGEDLLQCVGTGDEVEVDVVAAFVTQVLQGVDGVGEALPVDVDPTD